MTSSGYVFGIFQDTTPRARRLWRVSPALGDFGGATDRIGPVLWQRQSSGFGVFRVHPESFVPALFGFEIVLEGEVGSGLEGVRGPLILFGSVARKRAVELEEGR